MHAALDELCRRYDVPACGVAVLVAGRKPLIEIAGQRRRDRPGSVAIGDRWHIGSCAKAATALTYARLVERGIANWETPVAELFADLGTGIHPDWRNRTIDEVFHCRAGIPANLTKPQMIAAWDSREPLTSQRTTIASHALSKAPLAPGQFVYSNLGYILIGAAIDRIVGILTPEMDFERALMALVLHPLGIKTGGFGPPPEICGHSCRFRVGPITLGRGSPVEASNLRNDNPPVMNSAGRLHLSMPDWARLQAEFLDHASLFLRKETYDRLLASPSSQRPAMSMGWAHVKLGGRALIAMQGSNTLWGATAVMDYSRRCMVLITCNDGRSRVLRAQLRVSAQLCADATAC